MKIGSFKFDERASDIIGKIATRDMRFPYLIMRRVEDRQSDSAPVYEIYETNRAGDEIQIGVVWERRMKSNDEVFLRSEEHTSELQSLMRISYAVFCLQKKIKYNK